MRQNKEINKISETKTFDFVPWGLLGEYFQDRTRKKNDKFFIAITLKSIKSIVMLT